MQKNKLGGKAIDSGTYGCVFIPSLKCKNKKTRTNGVSKLMLNKHAINEIESLKQLYQLMNAYPNMNKYMIIPKQELCNPDYLTPKDLIHFNSTCNQLYNYGFNESNIHQRINELSLLHMEYGGITVSDYIKIQNSNLEYYIYKGIADVYHNVIIPMNSNGLIHSDIKDNNILIKNNTFKLIDFGLMFNYDNTIIYPSYLNHTLSLWIPFSVVFFNDDILFNWSSFFNQHKHLTKSNFISICTMHIKNALLHHKEFHTFTKRESSLYSDLKLTCDILYPKVYFLDIISKQLAYIYYYHKNNYTGEFDILAYYNNEFIHIIDIWGLCTILISLLTNYKNSNDLINFIKKYMFGAHQHPFPVNDFYKDITILANKYAPVTKKPATKKPATKKHRTKKHRTKKHHTKKHHKK